MGKLDPREAAPLTDAGLTSYHAVKRSIHLLGPGSTAVVIGAGGLGQMAIQVLKALCSATTVVAVDTSADKLEIAKKMGADEGLASGDETVKRIKVITRGQGAELVLDLVGVNSTLAMAAQMARVLGHLTIVGLGNAALPVNFNSPPQECSVASPFWGSIPELIEVIELAQTGKIKMLVSILNWTAQKRRITACTMARFRDAPSSRPTTDLAHLVGGDRLRDQIAVRQHDLDLAVDQRLAAPQHPTHPDHVGGLCRRKEIDRQRHRHATQ